MDQYMKEIGNKLNVSMVKFGNAILHVETC
jgi:hypothetical protein